jgi:hypothetical protein
MFIVAVSRIGDIPLANKSIPTINEERFVQMNAILFY